MVSPPRSDSLVCADVNNGPSHSSRAVLARPRLGGFGATSFGATTSGKSNTFGSVLRPPQLKATSNPFLKAPDHRDEDKPAMEQKDNRENEPTEDRLKDDTETPKFMPLGSSNSARSSNPVPAPQQSSSSSAFVFGQNLSARVLMNDNANNGDVDAASHSSSNGTSELLFTSAAATVKENNQEDAAEGGAGLAAAAAEYERARARPPPPTATCTFTGEEGETNVLQISCRLFAWESGGWRERGRGMLRLNDATDGGARLVARVAGSLRVLLNTKLWPEMVVERAAAKSLRITAAPAAVNDGKEQGQIKLFLIMGAPGDIAALHRALSVRVALCRRAPPAPPAPPAPEQRLRDAPPALPAPHADEHAAALAPAEHDKVAVKRKEPIEDGTEPKRLCPKIIVE